MPVRQVIAWRRLEATVPELAAAFTEWERRYREEPGRFASEAAKAAESPESYGEACAPYLVTILDEQRAKGDG